MLERLRAKVLDAGLTNVDVVEAGFLTYRHDARPADFVYSRYALHHLPDLWKAVALAHGTDGDEGWSRPELEEHVRDESSTFTGLLEPMMERTGFRVDGAAYSDDGFFAKYVLRRP